MVQQTCRAKSKRQRSACLLWVLVLVREASVTWPKEDPAKWTQDCLLFTTEWLQQIVTLQKTAALSSRAPCTVRNELVEHLYETLECASLAVAFESSSSRKCTIFDNVTRSVGVLKHVCQILLWCFFSVLFLVNDFVCNLNSKGPFKKHCHDYYS